MRQKVANQNAKKNFILYKGHTGWKIKTRLFGTLLVGLSAVAIAESTGTVDVHAATGDAPVTDTSSSPAPATSGSATLGSSKTDGTTPTPTVPTTTTPTGTAPTNAAPAAESYSINAESGDIPAGDPAASATADAATSAKQYQTLTPDQSMTVGQTDGSGVTLSGSQVQDHFTNTVENFNKSGADDNQFMNKKAHSADPTTGVWQLTNNGTHSFWGKNNNTYEMQVDGPQTAHVSFENEIDFGHDFTLTGALGIGTKASGGADGIGIVFAPGDPAYATTGKVGGNLGVGGLDNAFAFVYDDIHNDGSDDTKVVDPGSGAYFGWRSTDANGTIQNVTNSNDWKAASSFNLSNRATDPLVDFSMTYDSKAKLLTVTIQNQNFTRSLADIDTSKGYSISIAASTGGQTNDYSARIDSFTYTPKTASVDVKVATAAGDVSTTTPVTANIGDTISVFSTKEAAERAVAADPTLDPSLVTVIPASTTNNVYVVDGDQATASNGTVHASSLADASYYSYKVTGDASQAFSVPISQAFKANVTPVDSVTKEAIPGMDPIQVTTVVGKSVVVQVPGYTPVTVVLDAPAAGETVAQDKVLINTSTTPSTETDVANPIEHYYTATGETIDGTPVTANVTVGTNQSVTDALNATPIGEDGKAITDGSTPAYTWSTVPNAAGTDSTDSTTPQDSKSILVPTKSTLDKWIQQATDNQTKADTEKAAAQDIYDKFVASPDITADQKTAAKSLLDSVNAVYENLSKTNADAKASLEDAENSTDPATIVTDSQAGYAGISGMDTSLSEFKNDVDNMSTTNAATQASMVSFKSWSQDYGTPLKNPEAVFGDGFSTTPVSDDQVAGLFADPANFYYVDALDSDTSVTPKDVGTYYFKLTEKGRTYIKNLTPDNPNAGLYVSGTVTINPVVAAPTIKDTSVVYGAKPKITGSLGSDLANTDDSLTQDDFEIIDNATKEVVSSNQLQAGGDYTIQYTTDAQNTLKKDTNYTFGDFGTAKLTVTPAAGNVAVTGTSVTYGDSLPSLSVSVNGADTSVLSADNFEIVDTTTNSVLPADKLQPNQLQADNNGRYKVQLTQAAQDTLSAANGNFKLTFGTGALTVNKRPITVNINDVTTDYDGSAHGANGFSIAKGDKLVDGDTSDALSVTLNPISETEIKTYTITGKSDSANYDVTVNNGTLKILGQTDDGKGNKTTTEKDAAGKVVRIDKHWADDSETTYKYDPDTGVRSVSEQKNGVQVGESQTLTSDAKVTLTDGVNENTSTVVALDPKTNQPTFEHDTTTPTDNNTTTTTDTNGNVVKVVKTWPKDNSTTTYTYDPLNGGTQTVTEEKEGEDPVTQEFTEGTTQTTVKQGKTDTTVTAQPGSAPTFAHDTTDTNEAGDTTTTTDADGNVIKVVKTWPKDNSTTTYTYDPSNGGTQTVTEEKDGEAPVTQEFTEGATQTTVKQGKTDTTVTAQPGSAPTFAHDTTDTNEAGDTTTT
uniref:lectin-like domain-containing protein n=1 Tax=Levilactobacillus yonginensis TaxID=1054041 RepID=UPI0013DE0814